MRIHTQGKKKYDFYSFLIIVLILLLAGFFAFIKNDKKKINELKQNIGEVQEIVSINNTVFNMHVADTFYKRTLGLSIFESFDNSESMLFIFEKADYHSMWMKNMKFPIDILWLNKDKKIIYLIESADPKKYPETYKPLEKSSYVLELNAGVVKKENIKIGDSVSFDL